MKITFTLIDDEGREFVGNAVLSSAHGKEKILRREVNQKEEKKRSLDFRLNHRAFIKKYCRGLSGPQKFTLLLAKFTQGRSIQQVKLEDVTRQWNKMQSLMHGKFHWAYSNRAKDNGWVDTPKPGVYVLCDSWKEAFEDVSS